MTLGGHIANDPRRTLAPGAPVHVWENPNAPFEGTPSSLRRYAERGAWDLLFNAMVLTYAVLRTEESPYPTPLPEAPPAPLAA